MRGRHRGKMKNGGAGGEKGERIKRKWHQKQGETPFKCLPGLWGKIINLNDEKGGGY